jgi:diaminopropionate ammonia-lyase
MSKSIIESAAHTVEMNKFIVNKKHKYSEFPNSSNSLDTTKMDTAQEIISSWPEYKFTKLHSLEKIAGWCGIKAVYYKDEATRFDLGSFKALGGAYAVSTLVQELKRKGGSPSNLTVTTATDGNHGRSVSWGAQLAGCNAKIFIHSNVSSERERAMSALGADVVRVDGNYEASLAECKKVASLNNWPIVSDTSWEGYRDIPLEIMAGYSLMTREILKQMGPDRPTHTFLPIGVGGLAAGVVAPLWQDMQKNLSKVISVESNLSPCFLKSIEAGEPVLFDIKKETIMAGLSCGEVSDIAWEILETTLSHCMSITDEGIPSSMRLLANGNASEVKIEAGECSAAGVNALLAARKDDKIWKDLELDKNSIVLLIGTEGATDRKIYNELLKVGENI